MTGQERRKPEKTQPGNPHGLTLRQHILPARSIERFAGTDGCVSVLFKNRPSPQKSIRVSPDNPLFCANRVWDHGSETSCKSSIEDPFQVLAERIISGVTTTIVGEDKFIVDSFYGLWEARSFYNLNPIPDVPLSGAIAVERELSKDEQELLEKNNVSFVKPNLTFSGRDLTGDMIVMRINQFRRELEGVSWSIVRSSESDFFVPNAPKFPYVPISPTVSLIAGYPNALIGREEVGRINGQLYGSTDSYIFARDFSRCSVVCSEIRD